MTVSRRMRYIRSLLGKAFRTHSVSHSTRNRYIISSLCLITLSLSLSSCSPERRAILRLTALNFKTQAYEAIAATKEIYKLTPNARPETQRREVLVRRLLTDPSLDYSDREQIDQVIARSTGQSPATPSKVNQALDDLRQEYNVAAETFENIEKGGLLGTEANAVSETAEPSRRLTVKMLLLAEMIRQNPPTPRSSARVWIYYQLDRLRSRYTQSNSEVEQIQIRQSTEKLIDELFTINADEKTLVCQTTAKLLLTAQTGTKLSTLVEKYSQLSFNEIMAKISAVLGIASSLSGSDLTAINVKITEIKQAIQDDPVLNKTLNELPQEVWQSNTSLPALLSCSP
jgi:hypothetical protein